MPCFARLRVPAAMLAFVAAPRPLPRVGRESVAEHTPRLSRTPRSIIDDERVSDAFAASIIPTIGVEEFFPSGTAERMVRVGGCLITYVATFALSGTVKGSLTVWSLALGKLGQQIGRHLQSFIFFSGWLLRICAGATGSCAPRIKPSTGRGP